LAIVAEEIGGKMSDSKASDVGRDFALLEYQALQDRLSFVRNDLTKTETFAPLAVAALISWGLANETLITNDRAVFYAIPLILTLVTILRFVSRFRLVLKVEEYFRLMEAQLSAFGGLTGYENHIKPNGVRQGFPFLMASRVILFGSMLMVTGYMFFRSL
jgi:hypothetical protein